MTARENLEKMRDEMIQRAQNSQNIDEVRSLHADIDNVRKILDNLDAEQRSEVVTHDTVIPATAEQRTIGSFNAPEVKKGNVLESNEYRSAFMAYAQNGTPIPAELRGEAISTNETGAAIPLTIMNEVINTVRVSYGNLYAKVRKLSVPGGVEFPIGSLKATFKWINEGEVSPRQKVDALGKISFGYHTAEIRLSQTFLANLVTLSAFERELSTVIAEAYLEAMDYGIVNGSGNGAMTGILNDARVTNVITMTAAQMNDWMEWRKRFFAKLPLKYRAGEFIFPLSTVETYLESMHDSMNNPIFRQATGLVVNDGDARDPNGTFFGRRISLVEPDIIPDFDTASAGDTIGIFWQPDQYAINENFGFTMRRYYDEETNEWVDKALTVVDGKVLNPVGYYLIKKANA